MKYFRILICLSLFISFSVSKAMPDSLTYSKKIKEQAKLMGDYMLKKDFKSFTAFTYPKVIEMMGGEENMIHVMEAGEKEMDANGSHFLSVTVGEPSTVISIGNELQCTLAQVIEMKVWNGTLLVKSSLIGISSDKGKIWYFLDTSDKDINEMKKVLPNLSERLVIPVNQEPLFHHD